MIQSHKEEGETKMDKKKTTVCITVDKDTYEKAKKILQYIGLKPSEAVNIFIHQIALRNGLPFDIKLG